jgi:hypothetical protein
MGATPDSSQSLLGALRKRDHVENTSLEKYDIEALFFTYRYGFEIPHLES